MDKKQRMLAFISLAISCFLTILDSTVVNISLPSMASYFNTDITGISWVSTAYLIPFSALLINFSKIADIYGRKKVFIIGLIVFGTASILCGFTTSLYAMIVFRIIQGIGAAILAPLAIPLGIEIFGKQAMSKLSVIVGMIMSISAASGPVLGGFLNETFGFKSIFYVNIPFIIIALIFGAKYVKECYDKTIEKKVDFIGSVLLAYGVGALTFLLVKGSAYGWGSTIIMTLIVTSLISIIGFIIYEFKAKNPMIEFELFKTKSFVSSVLIVGVILFGYMPISYLMNFYLENQLGYTVLQAGMILGIVSFVSFLTSPIFGFISAKFGSRINSLLAIVFVCGGDSILVVINSSSDIKLIYTSFIIVGLALGAISPMYKTAFEEISNDKNGIASGILNSFRQLASCLSIALVSTLSIYYTAQAVDNSKARLMAIVNNNAVLEQQVKSTIYEKIQTIDNKQNISISKDMVDKLIEECENTALASNSDNMKKTIQENFNTQKQEIYIILDEAAVIKNDETSKVYNKCFLVIIIISAFGLIAVPFNKKMQNDTEPQNVKSEVI